MPHPADIRPEPYRPPSREQIERARAMYSEGFTVSRILAACDMSLGTFYYWLDGGPQAGSFSGPTADQAAAGSDAAGATLYPPLARRRSVLGKRRKPLSGDRVSLAARLWRTAELQARDLEERLARPSGSSPERERDLRMFGAVVRALRDLSAFDPAGGEGGRPDADARVEQAWREKASSEAMDGVSRAVAELAAYRDQRTDAAEPSAAADRVEAMLERAVNVALTQWERTQEGDDVSRAQRST